MILPLNMVKVLFQKAQNYSVSKNIIQRQIFQTLGNGKHYLIDLKIGQITKVKRHYI